MLSFRHLKEGSWIVLGQVMLVLGALVGVRLLTGLMTPSEYGKLALGVTIATFVGQAVMGPIANGVTRFYAPAVERGDLGGYLKAVRFLTSSAIGFFTALILILIVSLLILRIHWIGIVIAASIYAALSGCNAIFNMIQNAARQRSVVALHQGLEPWARCLAAAGLMAVFGTTSIVALTGYALAVVIILGSQYLFFRKVVSANAMSGKSREWVTEVWKYSWPFASWGVFTWAQMASDRWALGMFGTLEDVGHYAALYQLGYYPMSLAAGMLMQLYGPIFYQKAGDGNDHERNTVVKKMCQQLSVLVLAATCAASILIFVFHKELFRIFVAQEYTSASHLLPWLFLSGGIFTAGQLISLDLMSQMKSHDMVAAKIGTALGGIVLNFTGAYLFGINGIVSANVIFSIAYLIWIFIISKWVFGASLAEVQR